MKGVNEESQELFTDKFKEIQKQMEDLMNIFKKQEEDFE